MNTLRLRTAQMLSMLLLMCAQSTFAQQTPDGFGFKVYKTDSTLYPFVQIYMRTYDEKMDPLLNVNTQNIGLLIKGKPVQNIEKTPYTVESMRGRTDTIRTIVVMDTSKTMQGTPFNAALEAVARYIDFKRPQDQIAIIALDDSVAGFTLVSDFERNKEYLARRLADLDAIGNTTRLYDGIATAMQMSMVAAQGGTSSQEAVNISSTAILVFSDGKDEGSALTRSDLMGRISQMEIPVPVYSVAYTKIDPVHLLNLQAISRNSIGKYFDVRTSFEMMTPAVENVHSILQGDYVVTFLSDLPVDGEKHNMKIGLEWPNQSGRIRFEDISYDAMSLISFPVIKKMCEDYAARFAGLMRREATTYAQRCVSID